MKKNKCWKMKCGYVETDLETENKMNTQKHTLTTGSANFSEKPVEINAIHSIHLKSGQGGTNSNAEFVNELLDLLVMALPCVEESEQYDKPTTRKLSKRIRAIIESNP